MRARPLDHDSDNIEYVFKANTSSVKSKDYFFFYNFFFSKYSAGQKFAIAIIKNISAIIYNHQALKM